MFLLQKSKKWLSYTCLIAVLNLVNIPFCSGIATYEEIPIEGYENAARGLPIGRIDLDNGHTGTGSLVEVNGQTVVITAAHVLHEAQSATFVFEGDPITIVDWKISAGYKINERKYDIAVAFLDSVPSIEPFKIGKLSAPHVETELFALAGFGRRGVLDPNHRGRYCEDNPKVALAGTIYVEKRYDDEGGIFFAKYIPWTPSRYAQMKPFFDHLSPYDQLPQTSFLECSPLPGDSGGPLYNPEKHTISGVCSQGSGNFLCEGEDFSPAYLGLPFLARHLCQTSDWMVRTICPSLTTRFQALIQQVFHLPEFSAHNPTFTALHGQNVMFIQKSVEDYFKTSL